MVDSYDFPASRGRLRAGCFTCLPGTCITEDTNYTLFMCDLAQNPYTHVVSQQGYGMTEAVFQDV